jgi:hypothetical protein
VAYEKKPTFHYANLQGINNKVSPYINDQMEFLDLKNLDFQVPGSLKKRWGSTQYFGASLSGKVNGLFEFNQTSGASYLYAVAGGTMGYALNNGFSAIFSGSTAGASYFGAFGSSFVDGVSLASLDLDFITLQNSAIFANGKQVFKATSGNSIVFFGLPRFQTSLNITPVVGNTGAGSGFTGVFYYKMAWINSYGLQGAPTQVTTSRYGLPAITAGTSSITVSVGTTAGFSIVPPNTDISAIGFFRTDPQPTAGSTLTQPLMSVFGQTTNQLFTDIDSLSFSLVGTVGVSAGSIAATFVDTNYIGGNVPLNNNILSWNWYPQDLILVGLTANVGFGMTFIPRFLEVHDGALFVAGMSYGLSSVWFSEFNEPESFQPDSNFEVRTNDGEVISALKSYNGNLVVFKPSSFHSLNTAAEAPQNWVLTQISPEYGCLSNRAVTEYNDLLVFLDRKGIIRFNGANIEILSTKVDSIFQRMNVSAAMTNAQMTYDKQRNQILCDIPVDGATMNNLTVVYDIISNAFTTYTGYNSAVNAVASGSLSTDQIFYGGYSGLVSYFGSSFASDNGVGYTCVAQSAFSQDIGYATEKLYRRLYSDTVPQGSSSLINVNFYQDYGSSIVLGMTIAQTPFQTRLEFGIPARSLSVEYIMGSTHFLTLHGFTIEYRFLRNI